MEISKRLTLNAQLGSQSVDRCTTSIVGVSGAHGFGGADSVSGYGGVSVYAKAFGGVDALSGYGSVYNEERGHGGVDCSFFKEFPSDIRITSVEDYRITDPANVRITEQN